MLFHSVEFIFIFLPISCIIIYLLQNKNFIVIKLLLIGSFIFYAYHSIYNLFLMIISILFNFLLGKNTYQNRKILYFGVFFNIALIAYFKYTYFIIDNIQTFFNLSLIYDFKKVALPLGISFFTFQQIAYLVDNYNGQTPEKNIFRYALLVSFFPHSIAGPLVQYKEIAQQFENIKLSVTNIAIGGTIFIIGLFKKIIIADGLAPCVNAVFGSLSINTVPSFAEAWFAAICFTLQLYFDFSGYSDMAIGLAKIFNISFPLNFDSPYTATSIIGFWHKWHITLSNFLKNYIYIPLGGNRHGSHIKYRNILITMLIGGLWHGASWTFIVWGGFHAVCLIINHIWYNFYSSKKIYFIKNNIYQMFSWFITITTVVFAWVLFRAETFKEAIVIYKSMLGLHGISISPSLENIIPRSFLFYHNGFFSNQLFYFLDYLPLIMFALFISLFLPNIKNFLHFHLALQDSYSTTNKNFIKLKWAPSTMTALSMSLMSVWIVLALLMQRKIDFLYFNF